MTAVSPLSRANSIFKKDNISLMSHGASSSNIENVIDQVETTKYRQVAKMIMVIMIPVVAMASKAGILFSASLDTQNAASVLQTAINRSLQTTGGVHRIQVERGLTALFLGTKEADIKTFQRVANARHGTNEFLVGYRSQNGISPPSAQKVLHTGKDILNYLEEIRRMVDDNRNITVIEALNLYTEVTTALNQDTVTSEDVPSRQDIWPLVVAFSAISSAVDVLGLQRALGGAAFSSCYLSPEDRDRLAIMSSQVETFLDSAFRYSEDFVHIYQAKYEALEELPEMIESKKMIILNERDLSDVCTIAGGPATMSGIWFDVMTEYMAFMTSMERYLTTEISSRLPIVQDEAARGMAAYLSVMIIVTFICVALSIWYSIKLNGLMRKLKIFGNNVREKSEEVKDEKKKTDYLLYQMMPPDVADKMKLGLELMPESFDSVTVYFSDIVGWAEVGTKLSPHELVGLLNTLYSSFDGIIDKYDVYKVETIADSYMCVSGLPDPNGFLHVLEIGQMALDMIDLASSFTIQNLPGVPLNLRIGFHSGSCVAGVVGTKMPRYCLFGDTVNTASRMETNGQAKRIHVSSASKKLMDKVRGFTVEPRGKIAIKGKGEMETYWLLSYTRPTAKSPIRSSGMNGNNK